jgi:hypothetical protein
MTQPAARRPSLAKVLIVTVFSLLMATGGVVLLAAVAWRLRRRSSGVT